MRTRDSGSRRVPTTAFLALAPVLVLAAGCGGTPDAPAYRGVVIVVMDTVRADRTSLLGHSAPTSPALARLAARSRTYETCWSPSPWTAPAHASLFTGQLPDRHGLRRATSMFLHSGAETLAHRLSEAGFATAGFSGSPNAGPMTGLDQGFDRFDEMPGDAMMGRPLPANATGYSDEISARALQWITEQRTAGRPHLAFVNVFDSHIPYDPPLDAAQRFAGGRPFELVEWARRIDHPFPMAHALGLGPLAPEQLDALNALYDAEISIADRAVGALVQGLERLGATADTLVVVLSDHGENIGHHGLMDHMLSVHASLLHVPLVVSAPGVFDDGARVRELVRVEDVAPTVLDLLGLAPFAEADGVSLRVDEGPRVAHAWLDPMLESQVDAFGEVFPGMDLSTTRAARRSVFDGRLHLLVETGRPDRLFDVVSDPGESRDLAAQRPDDVRRLRALIDARRQVLDAESAVSPR